MRESLMASTRGAGYAPLVIGMLCRARPFESGSSRRE
jgi:hypothetical protein